MGVTGKETRVAETHRTPLVMKSLLLLGLGCPGWDRALPRRSEAKKRRKEDLNKIIRWIVQVDIKL